MSSFEHRDLREGNDLPPLQAYEAIWGAANLYLATADTRRESERQIVADEIGGLFSRLVLINSTFGPDRIPVIGLDNVLEPVSQEIDAIYREGTTNSVSGDFNPLDLSNERLDALLTLKLNIEAAWNAVDFSDN